MELTESLSSLSISADVFDSFPPALAEALAEYNPTLASMETLI
jgi:hypothetical protein